MELEKDNYRVLEDDGNVQITILRSGDISNETKVYLLTKAGTAKTPEDFKDRQKDAESIVLFKPGRVFR